jgi:hypothetical protein
MVTATRTPVRTDRLRPLNVPRRVRVFLEPERNAEPAGSPADQPPAPEERRRWQRPRVREQRIQQEEESEHRKGTSVEIETSEAIPDTLPTDFFSATVPSPVAVEWNGKRRGIESVIETWRIDDEWWRDQIARRYVEVVLDGGKHVVLFQNLLNNEWFVQEP